MQRSHILFSYFTLFFLFYKMLQARKPLAKKENDEIGSKQQKQKSNQARIYYSATLDVVPTPIDGINKNKYFQT